jgi:hypothetical protein
MQFSDYTNVILVVITGYYAWLTRKLSSSSSKAIEQSNEIIVERRDQEHRTKLNYLYLLNSEIYMNSLYYIVYIHSTKNVTKENITITGLKDITNIKDSKTLMRESVTKITWEGIKNECAGSFSNNLMEDLVGYYSGVHSVKLMTNDRMNDDNILEYTKGQLISTLKCFELIDEEGKTTFRRTEIYEVDNKKYKINKDTGDLISV